ncbi:MAG TPA: hypothetical protein DCZ94_20225 [Lentisphaeria bacterium]|nr:MAG: hypothetical protein A2X48_02540 [Lentisphaerae bacterium GWF2_49_21]HBC89274.1 hypothetical protein [Lentisphaeria bacterium]
MTTQYECIPCFVRQASEALAILVENGVERERLMRQLLGEISVNDWRGSPPVMAQHLHRIIRQATKNKDPYSSVKNEMNRIAEGMMSRMREMIRKSENPRELAVRLAIAGNLLDSGAKTQISKEELPQHMDKLLAQPLRGNAMTLFQKAEHTSKILYLADNAGEIYFDRLLIEMLPPGKVTFAVRGGPVVNDATMEDAKRAGIAEIARVISNGSDAPGTILDDTSSEFRLCFGQADMIIAKGQGNYETLSGRSRKICFMLTVKCPVIARHIGEPVGSMVIKM